MKPVNKLFIILSGILAGLLIGACALNLKYLKTRTAERLELKGSYTVIFYGANHYNDIATVAILVPEGSPYTFDIFAPEFNYRMVKGVPARDAVAMARHFVSWNADFLRSETNEILDANGKVIGYEIRPLYRQTTFGRQDVMYVDYFLKDNNVVEVHIHLYPDIEYKFIGDGTKEDSH